MAHMIEIIKCKKGHTDLNITFDSNECGCHHNGDPCLIISCRTCFVEALKNDGEMPEKIYIPLGKKTMKELKEFSQER